MRKVLGLSLSVALALTALMAVPAAAGQSANGECASLEGQLISSYVFVDGSPLTPVAGPNNPEPWFPIPDGKPNNPGQSIRGICLLGTQ